MNDRIKELWEQGTFSSIPRIGDYCSVSADNIKEFTKLIIMECAEAIREDMKKFPAGDLSWKCAMEESAKVVEEHFGVE